MFIWMEALFNAQHLALFQYLHAIFNLQPPGLASFPAATGNQGMKASLCFSQ